LKSFAEIVNEISFPWETILFDGVICIFVTGFLDVFVLLLQPEKPVINTIKKRRKGFIFLKLMIKLT
jgi:hypothetical protein